MTQKKKAYKRKRQRKKAEDKKTTIRRSKRLTGTRILSLSNF